MGDHFDWDSPPVIVPIRSTASNSTSSAIGPQSGTWTNHVAFDRQELSVLLSLYGRKVAAGEWRDYALDFTKDRAVFSVFRRTAEYPLYRIEKNLKFARRQGAYSVIAAGGQILKRGHELDRVLRVLEKSVRLVDV